MGLDFERFGLTNFVGAYFVAGSYLLYKLIVEAKTPRVPNESTALIAVVFLITTFGLGVIIEDVSESTLDDDVFAFSDDRFRIEALFDTDSGVFRQGRLLTPRPLAFELARESAVVRSCEGLSSSKSYYCASIERYIGLMLSCQAIETEALSAVINPIYFRAKGRVMTEDNYFRELREIKSRAEFLRSTAFCSAILFVVSIAFLLVHVINIRSAIRVDRALGAFALSVSLLVVVFLLCVVTNQHEEREYARRVFAYFLDIMARPHGG